MSSKSNLDDYYNQICKEMITLKALRDEVTTTGEPRLTGWSQIVKQKEDEIDELEKELKQKSMGAITKKKLEDRLVRCLKAVQNLIRSKDDISEAMGAFIKEVATWKPKQYPWAQIKKFTFDPKQELGRGVFGVVYKGTLDGEQVAIKVLNNNLLMDNMEKEFKAEVNAMSKTYHRNLAELYGFCFDPKMKALVYEYMENGSLDQILYKNPSNVPWEKLYKIAIGTARGLSYLHESCKKRIIHRDIKAGNVLLDSNLLPKLTDFGLARISSADNSQVTLTAGLRRARSIDAPEVRLATTQKINYKSDVFSFGMLLLEILSRKKWEDGNLFAKQVWEKYQCGKQDEIIRDCGIEKGDEKKAKTLITVALLCIEHMAKDRPSMIEVVNILNYVILPKEPKNPYL